MLHRLSREEHAACRPCLAGEHAVIALGKVRKGKPGVAHRDCSILRRAQRPAHLSHLAALQYCFMRAVRLQSHASAIVKHHTQNHLAERAGDNTG